MNPRKYAKLSAKSGLIVRAHGQPLQGVREVLFFSFVSEDALFIYRSKNLCVGR